MSLLIKIPAVDISAIKAKTDLLPADPASETGNIATVKAKTDNLPASPADEATVNAVGAAATAIKAKTDLIGASVALENGGNLAAVKAKTDNLPANPTSETGGVARKFPFLDFWSAPIDKITVTDTALDIDFGFVIVTGLPSGFTIKKVETIMTCRAIKDTSGANNKINANNRGIRVMKAAGTWGVDDVVGIYFAQDSLYCAAGAKEAGPVIIGWPDIKSEVDGNDIYHIMSDQTHRSDALVAMGNGLELYDVQVGLRVFFS